MPLELVSLSANKGVDYNSLSLDSVASIHNEAMVYVVDRVAEDKICPKDDEEFRNRFASYI